MSRNPDIGRVSFRISAVVFCLLSLTAASRVQLPRIEIPLVIDLGEVWLANTIEHEFTVNNTGDAPLRIRDITCETHQVESEIRFDEIIDPGESGDVFITLNTENITGRNHHICRFSSDDPAHKNVYFAICYEKRALIR